MVRSSSGRSTESDLKSVFMEEIQGICRGVYNLCTLKFILKCRGEGDPTFPPGSACPSYRELTEHSTYLLALISNSSKSVWRKFRFDVKKFTDQNVLKHGSVNAPLHAPSVLKPELHVIFSSSKNKSLFYHYPCIYFFSHYLLLNEIYIYHENFVY